MALESIINKYDIIEYEFVGSNKRSNVFHVNGKTISCINDYSSELIKNGYELIFESNLYRNYRLYFKKIRIHKIKISTMYWNLFGNFHKACFMYLFDKEDNELYRSWYIDEKGNKENNIIKKLLSESQLKELNAYLKSVSNDSLWVFIQKIKLLKAEAKGEYEVNNMDIEFEVT